MAWRYESVEDQREYLAKSYISKLSTMKELCEECGISRKTGYKWVARYLEEGSAGLSDHSRAPVNPHREYPQEIIDIALDFKRKRPKYGPKKALARLRAIYPHISWPSATRLYQVFKEHDLVCSRRLRRRVARTHPLGDVNHSNDVWCADFKGWFLTGDSTKVEPLTITDGFSRYAIRCVHLERKTSEEVWRVYCSAFEQYGLPLRVRTDNGPPFATTGVGRLSRLAMYLIKAGVTPEWITPGKPQENGRHERFHRSLKEEVASPPADTFVEQVQQLEVFTDEYNFERPHEALNQETPGSVYEPSSRQWDGILRSPNYDQSKFTIRKVGPSGCFHWKRMACYVGQLLAGEYVALEEINNGVFNTYYGPVLLGYVLEGIGFEKPVINRRTAYQG